VPLVAPSRRLPLPRRNRQVSLCGYSVPHPMEASVNVRVQTTVGPASIVLSSFGFVGRLPIRLTSSFSTAELTMGVLQILLDTP